MAKWKFGISQSEWQRRLLAVMEHLGVQGTIDAIGRKERILWYYLTGERNPSKGVYEQVNALYHRVKRQPPPTKPVYRRRGRGQRVVRKRRRLPYHQRNFTISIEEWLAMKEEEARRVFPDYWEVLSANLRRIVGYLKVNYAISPTPFELPNATPILVSSLTEFSSIRLSERQLIGIYWPTKRALETYWEKGQIPENAEDRLKVITPGVAYWDPNAIVKHWTANLGIRTTLIRNHLDSLITMMRQFPFLNPNLNMSMYPIALWFRDRFKKGTRLNLD